MISVTIVGRGNVGTHLWKALQNAEGIKVTHIDSRHLEAIEKSDVAIIAVSDDAIGEVSSQVNNDFVVHTSGSVSMNGLTNTGNKGVFYPLQTFTKDNEIDFTNIPFCLESDDPMGLDILESLVKVLNGNIFHVNSDQRKRLHVAAVFVNNFTNHMYVIAHEICSQYNIPFDILEPLIIETCKKIKSISPLDAQTGPAKRNDEETIQNHLNLLNQSQQEIYIKLTESIQTYGKKL